MRSFFPCASSQVIRPFTEYLCQVPCWGQAIPPFEGPALWQVGMG